MALELIDKQDAMEVIRDQIALILATEIANQKVLAAAAAKDPALWDVKIYTERSNPWEQFLNDPENNNTPLANVYFDTETFDLKRSNVVETQTANGIFNIDVYGYGIASEDGAGQKVSDKEAALEVQRAIRLIRNIIMAAENTYLQLPRGSAWDRMPQSITVFQPQIDGRAIQKVLGARLALNVSYNELSPQIQGNALDYLAVDVKRSFDGQIIVEADYDYTI